MTRPQSVAQKPTSGMAKKHRNPQETPLAVGVTRSLIAPLLRLLAHRLQRVYFRAVESVGYHKRDILISRVETARDSFEEAKEQFQTALEKFTYLTSFHGGELENVYSDLKSEFDYSQAKADGIKDRIIAIQAVGDALFEEWRQELEQYKNRSLKASSRHQLRLTFQHYTQLINAMQRAETRIDPVLSAFRDQVLFLKHNLNAQAIASLENELNTISINVTGLVHAMERSITEANAFMASLTRQKSLPVS